MVPANQSNPFFEELCRRYYEPILKYIYVKTGDAFAAKDLVQDVFLAAFEQAALVEQHENPAGYLYLLAKNKVYEHFRRQKRLDYQMISENSAVTQAEDLWAELETMRDRQVDEQRYKSAVLACLSDKNKQLYNAYYLQKHSMKEIAAANCMSEASVRMQFVRIRKQIKAEVRRTLKHEW